MTVHAISTGKLLGGTGAGYAPRSFYVSKNGGAWELTYTGWGNQAAAQGKLMNLRHIQAIFADTTGYPSAFDPQTNTDTYIAQLASYREHGMLAATIGLQGGWPDYTAVDGDISAFNNNGTANYGTGTATAPQTGTWWYRLKQVIEAMDDLGMFCILNVFYFRQDGHLTDANACREAVRASCQFLIANNYRNVLFDLVNEFGDGNYNHDILKVNSSTNGVAELVTIAKNEFNGLGWQPPVGVSMPGMWTAGGDLLTVSDIILPHGNNATIADINTRMAYYYSNFDMPVIMNEDHPGGSYTYGLVLNQTNFDREVDSMNACWNQNGSWGGMLYGYFQAFPFRWTLGATADITTEANYVKGICNQISSLTGAAPALAPSVIYSSYSNIASLTTPPEIIYSNYSNVASITTPSVSTEITVTTTIQAAHDIANPGDTIIIPAGVYNETVTATKSVTFQGQAGAIVDGQNTRNRWFDIRAHNVIIDGLEMRNAVAEQWWGGIVTGYSGTFHNNLTIRNCLLHDAGHAAIAIKLGNGHIIEDNNIYNCGVLGVRIDSGEDHIIRRNNLYNNAVSGNPAWFDKGIESGGIKLAGNWQAGGAAGTNGVGHLNGVHVYENRVYDNNGPGIWFDVNSGTVTKPNSIYQNRIWDNAAQGIVYEISWYGNIYQNRLWGNGFNFAQASRTSGWGAAVLIQNSDYCNVYENILAWNHDGITLVSQNDTNRGAGFHAVWGDPTGNNFHDNITIVDDTNSSKASFDIIYAGTFFEDFAGTINAHTHNNMFQNNEYWFTLGPTPNGQWDDPHRWKEDWSFEGLQWIADWNATANAANETLIDTVTKDAVLTANYMPTTAAGTWSEPPALVYARPISTISAGSWSTTGAATLHEAIDEEDINQTDYIESGTNPVADTIEFLLSPISTPVNRLEHAVSYWFDNGPNATGNSTVTVQLVEGTTIIAQKTETATDVATHSYLELTESEATSITDYTNLRIRFIANTV